MSAAADDAFEALLAFLRDHRGFDFTGYKRSSLMRRVRKRMAEVAAPSFEAYLAFLDRHPEEFTPLFNTILINVTGFWRDADAWESLTTRHLPALLATKGADAPVRVWSAGCASGEETYTLAMALTELLGVDGFRDRVKLYATDVDEEALAQARQAAYTAADLEAVPEALRARYFEEAGDRFVFRNDLRRLVIFGRNDLVRDAPISRLDLLVSRNVLMYFNADTQTRILNRFHFALNDSGLLFLGKAEMMRTHGSLFQPLDLGARIFGRVGRSSLRDRLLLMGSGQRPESSERLAVALRLRDAALDAQEGAQLVVGTNGTVVLANAEARTLFGLTRADVGRPLQDLTLSYRPVELRSLIEQALRDRRPVSVARIEHAVADGALHTFDVHVVPLLEEGGSGPLGVSVSYVDVTLAHRLEAALQETNRELEAAFEELQSSKEELETTNEELQSTIEELETTNEELQSTNEELETMNEELQSTNEELETINDELHRRTSELNDVNAYMASILTSLRAAVVVLDRQAQIRIWNRKAEDLWGLRADEVEGTAFQNLDIGLPVERLKGPVRACIEGRSDHEERVLEAVNRRGRTIRVRITCTPFIGVDREIRGAVVVMEEWVHHLLPGEPAGAEGA